MVGGCGPSRIDDDVQTEVCTMLVRELLESDVQWKVRGSPLRRNVAVICQLEALFVLMAFAKAQDVCLAIIVSFAVICPLSSSPCFLPLASRISMLF